MKERMKKPMVTVLVFVMCISLCGCRLTDNASVRMTIHKFEKSCNEMDLDGMIDCIEPTVAKVLRILPFPKDREELNDFLLTVIDLIYMVDAESADEIVDVFETLSIKPKSIEIDSRYATVEAVLSYRAGELKTRENITLVLTERGGTWYITTVY